MRHKLQLSIAILVLVVIAIVAIAWVHISLPHKTTGRLTLKGLHGPVMIYRDHYGVPHIEAEKNDLDAYFALGFVQAQDRLWQMTFQKHVASGTLSEIFGEKTLKEDELLRTWGFYRAAKTAWQSLDPKTKAMVQSYTDGINAFIARGHFPLQFKAVRFTPTTWTVIDSIAWSKLMAWNLQTIWQDKIKNYLLMRDYDIYGIQYFRPSYPSSAPTVLSEKELLQSDLTLKAFAMQTPVKDLLGSLQGLQDNFSFTNKIRKSLGFQEVPGKGSNAWVVSGKLTTTGKPLLASDPHLGLQAPAVWYLAELKGPNLHAIGATIPGLPGVLIGYNDHIAWGMTNANLNVQELYIVPKNAKLTIVHEKIKVRNAKTVDFPVEISKYGPVINQVDERLKNTGLKLAIHWPALMPGDTTVEGFAKIAYATNWHEFTKALQYVVTPTQSFIYADDNNNIGYYLAGKIPIRPSDWPGLFPVVPDLSHQWQGYIPFKNLPHVLNPKKGYIISANNKIVPDTYPYPLTYRWKVPPFRAKRIQTLLLAPGFDTIKRDKAIQLNTISGFWQSLKPSLLTTAPLDKHSRLALNILRTWQGDLSLKSQGAVVFEYWLRELTGLMPKEIRFGSHWIETLYLKRQIAYAKNRKFLSESLQRAMKKLYKNLGPNESAWQWGKVHKAVFNEVALGNVKAVAWMWRRKIATPGGDYTVNVGTFDPKNFQQIAGASYRQIIDLSNFNNSLYIQTLGQSENPSSSHYSDQMPMWRNGQYIKMQTQVQHCHRDKKACLVLLPKKIAAK